MELGERIRALRTAHGLSQTEFAQSIGVKQRMISYYETGGGTYGGTATNRVVSAIIDRYALPEEYFTEEAGNQTIKTIKTQKNETKTKKQEIYTRMLDVFISDFEDAQDYQTRTEIGNMILRLLEKL